VKSGWRIAIVGMGARFPGGPLATFFDRLVAGHDASSDVPAGRWLMPREQAVSGQPYELDRVPHARGYFLEGYDAPPEAAGLDPVFGLTLATVREAWQSAQTGQVDPGRVGLLLGCLALPSTHSSRHAHARLGACFAEKVLGRDWRETPPPPEDVDPAGGPVRFAARTLGFGGPTMAIDAACASSLYAFSLAARALRDGRADVMLAGGVARPDPLYTQMGFTQLRALAPDGTCRPFDAKGRGLVVGEGAGVFVLKRLDDALAHGDQILGLIQGVGVANDLDGSLMAPSSEGQLRAMRAAYEAAGWRPSDVDVIECHATGTPVGDAVEAKSLVELWRDEPYRAGQCVVGSVKANVGHMLTAAGASGLAKIVLAMRHGKIPPTPHYERHGPDLPFADSPFRVLREAAEWPRRAAGVPRRAALSGFGFGGIDAHLLLEEYLPKAAAATRPPSIGGRFKPRRPVAVVGIDVACRGLRGFDAWRALRREQRLPAPGAPRWWGAEDTRGLQAELGGEPIDAVLARLAPLEDPEVPLARFRFPPLEWRDMLPQQAWMLLVAETAARRAGVLDKIAPSRRGVAVGLALDGLASVFSMRWRLAEMAGAWGEELDALRRELGHELTAGRVIGALGNIVASRIARELRCGGFGFAVASGVRSGLDALLTVARAIERGEIDAGIAGAVDMPTSLSTYMAARAARRAKAAPEPARVADAAVALVLKDGQQARADGDRIYAWVETDRDGRVAMQGLDQGTRTLAALPDPESLDAGAAGAMLAVLDAVAQLTDKCDASGRYWLRNRSEGRRCVDLGSEALLIEPGPREGLRTAPMPRAAAAELLLLEADDAATLLRQLDEPTAHALREPRRRPDEAPARYRVALHAEPDRPGALGERIAAARTWLRDVGEAPESPLATLRRGEGYAFAASRRRARTAFMYPGTGSWYRGMGRDLAGAFPAFAEEQDRLGARHADLWGEGCFWDLSAGPLTPSMTATMSAQCAVGVLATQALVACGVQPDAAFGYSLGESAALLALGLWADRDLLFERLLASPVFTTELVGPMQALRRHWQLGAGEPAAWAAGIVQRSPEELRAALQGETRVYLLNINAPRECVVAGDPRRLQALYERLGGTPLPLPPIPALHCPVVKEVEREFRAFHEFAMSRPSGLPADFTFYSCARGEPVPLVTEAIADSILAHGLHGVDMPRLLRRVAGDGVELFVEPGPGAGLGRLVAACLPAGSFQTEAVCVRDGEERRGLLTTLLTAHAAGYAVDLRPLARRVPSSSAAAPEERCQPVAAYPAAPFRSGGSRHARQALAGSPEQADGNASSVTACAAGPSNDFHNVRNVTVGAGGQSISTAHGEPSSVALGAEAQGGPSDTTTHTVAFSKQSNASFEETMQDSWQADAILRHVAARSAEIAAQSAFLSMQSQFAASMAALLAGAPEAPTQPARPAGPRPWLDLAACREFARGSIGRVLGPDFAAIDAHPTRVRLPDGPLLLCHRIMSVDAAPLSMTSGTLVTEHDVTADAWYLDGGRIPTCVAVEAGQADLFLSAYLGADFHTKGLSVYRLLDATVIFHDRLPEPGATIHYVIRIDHFFRQGDTLLFRFGFDATVDGRPLITMRDGCAGFFSEAELAAGKGVVRTALQERPAPGKLTGGFTRPISMRVEALDDARLDALRRGDYVAAFDLSFAGLPLTRPKALPGGMLRLVHRIPSLEPDGGRWGLGRIVGEADIHPDDWFLTCHFVDDMVMPGTLMYECCMHTLRVFLMRMGWVGEDAELASEPMPGVKSRLKCRGQVLATTRKVRYEIELKEIGYGPDAYALADATMYSDDKAIVEIVDMSIRHLGLTKEKVEALWNARPRQTFGPDAILALAEGKPSEAFGPAFRRFDAPSVRVARLPRAPYAFLDRVDARGAEPLVMRTGGSLRGEYDVPRDAWYFTAGRGLMPFAVLNEIALQSCGFFSAYMGSALVSDADLYYRNLGGDALVHRALGPDTGRLITDVRCTKVARTGDMIIHEFAFALTDARGPVYEGTTSFGFFTQASLANQVGLRDLTPPPRPATQLALPYPERAALPVPPLRMIDTVTELDTVRGVARGEKRVDPGEWFFTAHFHQDPVMPGSLGLEAMAQLLLVLASELWPGARFESLAGGSRHAWTYRGQVAPTARLVEVVVSVTSRDEASGTLVGEGVLMVDGLPIYRMTGLAVRRL
jgi:acyl transferase domain-containing protein/3-hydroxymyristoyl/3-hydroxydecanoyl-(acyl carrier protein) dehydratase